MRIPASPFHTVDVGNVSVLENFRTLDGYPGEVRWSENLGFLVAVFTTGEDWTVFIPFEKD